MSLMRGWHATIALLALIGLIIEYIVTLSGHPGQLFGRTLIYWSFFTVLTNMLVMVMSAGMALGREWALRPTLRTAASVYITVVAVIFQLLLAKLAHHSPLGWWGNLLVHQLVPALWLAGWIGFGPHGGIDRAAPLRWLLYPLAFGAWTLVHGTASGWYPYPFVNVTKLGLGITLRNMMLMGVFFAGLGYAFRWIDGRLTALSRNRLVRTIQAEQEPGAAA